MYWKCFETLAKINFVFSLQHSHVVVAYLAKYEWNLQSCGLLVGLLSRADAHCCVAASNARVLSSMKFFISRYRWLFYPGDESSQLFLVSAGNFSAMRYTKRMSWSFTGCPRLLSANMCSSTVSMRSRSAFGFSFVTCFCETIAWTWARKIRRLWSYLFLRISHAVLRFASVIWTQTSKASRHLLSLMFLDTATFDSVIWLLLVTAPLNWSKKDVHSLKSPQKVGNSSLGSFTLVMAGPVANCGVELLAGVLLYLTKRLIRLTCCPILSSQSSDSSISSSSLSVSSIKFWIFWFMSDSAVGCSWLFQSLEVFCHCWRLLFGALSFVCGFGD